MKKTRLIAAAIGILALVGTTGILVGCKHPDASATSGATTGTQAHQYTCPMHPEIVTDKPGTCPKCGMELTEKQQQ